ncbi:MAG: fumarylacetoacetate hydrolase family protein, partial [Deltaproteobacteria bacterium]|nr:fumarylacetoacetate hydrolase family protein [Deltaproteobacteria bacterium]
MRLVRFGPPGAEKPGLLQDNRIVDLRTIFPEIPDINETFFRNNWLEKLRDVRQTGQDMDVRLGCPIQNPSKIICLGINYTTHTKEGGFEAPDKPLLFAKSPNALNGPYDPILLPQSCGQVDWEVELAVIIGRQGKR